MQRAEEPVGAAIRRARQRLGDERRRRATGGCCCLLLAALPLTLSAADPSAGRRLEADPPAAGPPGVDARATDGNADEAGDQPADPDKNGLQRAVDAFHAGLSSRVERTAQLVDAFFADDRYYADTTETYARLSLQTSFESGESAESEARLRVRVDLPGTEERLRLFIEGGDPEVGEGTESGSIPAALDDNDYNLGLEAQLTQIGAWDIRPGIGVKAGAPPDPFLRLRATRYGQLGSWLSRFSAGVAEFVDDGTEFQTRLDFDYKLSEDWLFRSASRARWLDRKDRTDLTQTLTLFQRLKSRAAVGYDVGLRADDDPDWEVNAYFVQVRGRYRAYRKWLFVELAPQVVFREEDDYDPSLRVAIRVDAVFGARYR
jgi:hypothetical protein